MPGDHFTCQDYQEMAALAPDLTDAERKQACLHLRDCETCVKKRTAFVRIQNREIFPEVASGS